METLLEEIKIATQSPLWDHTKSLTDVLGQATFFVLTKDQVLVKVILESILANGYQVYHYAGLSHDRYGVTYDCDGSLRSDYMGEMVADGNIELTQDSSVALRHIWECMHCAPFSSFKTSIS